MYCGTGWLNKICLEVLILEACIEEVILNKKTSASCVRTKYLKMLLRDF